MNLNEELKAYVDGQLSASERLEVEKAAASSEEIRAEIAALQALKQEIAPLTVTPEPTGKPAALAALRANRLVKPAGFGMRWGRWVTAGAAVLLAIAILPEMKFGGGARAEMAATSSPRGDLGVVYGEASKSAVPETTAEVPASEATATDPDYVPAEKRAEEESFNSASNEQDGVRPNPRALIEQSRTKAAATPSTAIPIVPRQYNRDIIYNGALSVAVPDVQKAVVEASSLITGLGGFIVSSQTNFEGGTGSAQLEIRVPAAKFDTANKSLAKYGRVISQNSSGQDVTADIARGEGRSRSLAVAEQEYIRMLNNARNTSSRLEIRRRLDEVRAEREGIKAETNRLKNLSAMSSLSLSFSEEESVKPDEPAENWWNDSNTGAANVLGFIGRILGRVAIYLVYLSPVWLAGLVGWLVWRKKQV